MKQETPSKTTEIKRQLYFIEQCRPLIAKQAAVLQRQLTYHVTTFGCQMNARDSEKLSGILSEMGYLYEEEEESADVVLYNTCSVRENADNKVYGRLGYLNGFKKKNPAMVIGLCGCMMQEPGVAEKIKRSYPFVDLVFGTHNLYRFAEIFFQVLSRQAQSQVIDLVDEDPTILEQLPVKRKYAFKSGVNIMFGCNNFCSYCIVPYVRGRERSRNPLDILREIETLADDGVVEIMLLGQNVNSYGKSSNKTSGNASSLGAASGQRPLAEEPLSFAELLREIVKIEKIKRIRFMTSHPKDLSDELIDVIAENPKICRHFHLPLQSGSNRILKKMNRRYTKEHYLTLVQKLRAKVPDISLTTDIIVGFPGETEADFLETLDVVERVRFDAAFTFLYSKRPGTPAASWEETASQEEIKARFNKLLERVQTIGKENALEKEGRIELVLAEQANAKEAGLLTGHTGQNFVVHFPGTPEDIGKILPVRLVKSCGFYFMGEKTGMEGSSNHDGS